MERDGNQAGRKPVSDFAEEATERVKNDPIRLDKGLKDEEG